MEKNEYLRILDILYQLPIIRRKIERGDRWQEIKGICEPLGLTDTAFRDHPSLKDFLMSYDYWIGKLHSASKDV